MENDQVRADLFTTDMVAQLAFEQITGCLSLDEPMEIGPFAENTLDLVNYALSNLTSAETSATELGLDLNDPTHAGYVRAANWVLEWNEGFK